MKIQKIKYYTNLSNKTYLSILVYKKYVNIIYIEDFHK